MPSTDEDVVDIFWNASVSHPEATLQESALLDTYDDCTFAEALGILRRVELIKDREYLMKKYACQLLPQSTSTTESKHITIGDLVQKAVVAYKSLLEGTVVVNNDHQITTQIRGRSLFSVIRYNPSRLRDENLLQLILYQTLCLLECFHRRGIPYLNLKPKNVFVDELLRVNFAPPCVQKFQEYAKVEIPKTLSQNKIDVRFSDEFYDVLSGWILKKVSNYDYLMYINRLAGRRAGDATASAILPWVTDFSSPQNGVQHLRDLTRTKFRLTKGEHQLDATYLLDQPGGSTPAREVIRGESFLPHHLLDMMPNLAYYTYKARQTSVEMLQRYVRPVYRPEEFPTSIQRLYATTPEECIPEFFTDPTIFTSVHPDMPDLQLPEWFSGSISQFLDYHRSILESDAVSANLHHWIDLTFGYKLLGDAAVNEKNVHLELVSPNPPPNSRVTCLFSLPHPRRVVTDDLSEAYDEMFEFFINVCGSKPPDFEKLDHKQTPSSVDVLLQMDLEDLACLITETAVGSAIPGVVPQLDYVKRSTRLGRARQLFSTYKSAIPSGFLKAVELLLFDTGWSEFPLGLLRRCVFDVPPHIVDLHRIHIGLHSRAVSRLEQVHFKDGPAPGALLNAFLASEPPPQRFDCPMELLSLLTSILGRGIVDTPACVVNALVSGGLVQFYLAAGGKVAVEKYLLPLIRRMPAINSRIFSRHFIRDLLLSTRLSFFLTTVPSLLADSLLLTPDTALPLPAISNVEGSTTTIDDAFLKVFLRKTDAREEIGGSNPIPLVAAVQDSLQWLATTLGPLFTATHLVPSLIMTLTNCYWGEENLTTVVVEERATRLNYRIPKSPLPMPVYTSGKILRGDTRSPGVLRCLERLACLYGVELITGLYLPTVEKSVNAALATFRHEKITTGGDGATSSFPWDTACEARLISSLVFLQQLVTYLPAPQLMDHLQEPIISPCLTGALTLAGRLDTGYPSGACGRLALLCKSLDCIYVLGVRLGFEIVRSQMTELIQLLFSLFDRSLGAKKQDSCELFEPDVDTKPVRFTTNCGLDEDARELESPKQQQQQQAASLFVIKLDRHTSSFTVAKEEQRNEVPQSPPSQSELSLYSLSTGIANLDDSGALPTATELNTSHQVSGRRKSAILAELKATFTPEMAYLAYIPLCRLAGGSHIESSLYNIDLIQSLVQQHEMHLLGSLDSGDDPNGGPKVTINTDYEAKLAASSSVSNPAVTHLHGAWSEYFRVKVRSSSFLVPPSSAASLPRQSSTFLGKRLVSFMGHNGSVRSITLLASENSFVSTSNDRTVHLYSLTSAREAAETVLSGTSGARTGGSAGTRRSSNRTTSESGVISHRSPSVPSPPTSTAAPTIQLTPLPPNFAFIGHRRPVLASAYLHFERLVASLDASLLLLWDPLTGQKVSTFTTSDSWLEGGCTSSFGGGCVLRGSSTLPAGLSSLNSTPAFRSTLLVGDEAGCLLLIDPRVNGTAAVVLRLSTGVAISGATVTSTTAPPTENLLPPPFGLSKIPLRPCDLDNLTDKVVLNVSGALRCMAPRPEDNNTVFCGFASGLVSHVDIRTGGVVATWRGHSDAVSQIFCHSSGWCSTTSLDRSIAFWRLEEGSTVLNCHRFAPHLTSGGGVGGIFSCVSQPLIDSLFIAGPPPTSAAGADSSPVLLPSSLSPCFLGYCDNVPLAATTTGETGSAFRPLGNVALRGGQLSAMAVLALTDAILIGSTSGLLSLFY